MSEADAKSAPQPARRPGRRLRQRFGAVAVAFALFCALATFFMLSGLTPIAVDDRLAFGLFAANVVSLLVVIALVVAEGWTLAAAEDVCGNEEGRGSSVHHSSFIVYR